MMSEFNLMNLPGRPARIRRRGVSLLQSLVGMLLMLLASLVPVSAYAGVLQCSVFGGANQIVAVGNISIPADPPAVGSTIYTGPQTTYTARCNNSNGSASSAGYFIRFNLSTAGYALVPGYTDVFQTNVPGVGVKFGIDTFPTIDYCTASNATLQTSPATSVTCNRTFSEGASTYPRIFVTTSLVVTGPINGGGQVSLAGPTVGVSYTPSDNLGASFGLGNLIASYSGQFTIATCSVNQTGVDVPLPNVGTGALSSRVGSIAGSTAFSLSFSCRTGAKVFITLTDSVNPANRGDTLQLTADSTAQGIGVQVLNGSLPISFGADSAAVGNTNQWLIGNSPNGPLQVPLTARYISTGMVAAGTVRALATFTMSYQ
jgi:type 1 fimbria pilin